MEKRIISSAKGFWSLPEGNDKITRREDQKLLHSDKFSIRAHVCRIMKEFFPLYIQILSVYTGEG